jgi:DNA-binding NarL/FixJ family response regulator
MTSERPRVLILGGGFAGVGAAQKLKEADADVVLVDRHDYHTFQPLLYQLATGLLETTAVGHSLRDLIEEHENATVRQATVTGVDLDAREVQFDGIAPIAYDYLVFALGAQVTFFGTEGAAEHAFPMYDAMHLWAERATSAAKAIGDPALIAAALAMPALAHAMTGETETARRHRAKVAALVDGMSDEELTQRPDAAAWLASAELYLDLYAEADTHASRALKLDRATGRGDPLFRLYQILPRVWYVRGKLSESAEMLDGAIEAGRLLGASPALAGNLFNRSVVANAVGDLETALAAAEEAAELTRGLKDGFVTAWAAVRLAGVLLETGQGTRAVELLHDRAGGEQLTLIPGSWRVYSLELLTRSWLDLRRREEAQRTAAYAEEWASALQLPLATAWARRATGMVELARGNPAAAAEHALTSAAGADEVGAPIESALSRILAGRALAQAGRSRRAIAVLQRAATELDACGAIRYRDQAERELGKLGHRTHRRTRPGNANGSGIETLTSREIQVARLVADRKTNPQIAADLFLSQKTVESHLRNIFRKIDVNSRVELARAVEHAERNQGAESGWRPDVGTAVR